MTVDSAHVSVYINDMRRQATPITDGLRQAILDSGMSLRQVGFAAGVDPAAVIRFVNGDRSLTLPSADRLATFLGLRLVQGRPGPPRRQEGQPGASGAF